MSGARENCFSSKSWRRTKAARLDAGDINARLSPWTGFKRSGVGSEMGLDGYAEFFTVRHLQWPEE